MGIDYQFRALASWPYPRTKERRTSPFRAGYARTLQDMERELDHLGARTVVIQAECTDDDIRQDGRIRSSARMRGPGIIISFQSKHGPLSYPCDTYTEWTDNLRAIVLAMAALRAVDRYGVTKRGEQYRGWKQLPGGDGGGGGGIQMAEWATVEDAALFLLHAAEAMPPHSPRKIIDDPAERDRFFRIAARRLHPDVGGSAEQMSKVNRARDFIEKAMRA